MSKKPTHIDDAGLPQMVDVGDKATTTRIAEASGRVILGDKIMSTLADQGYSTPKGSIIQTAVIAATMAVKNTYNTIPLCHQIPISSCKVFIDPTAEGFAIKTRVKCAGQTGVEMEALHGASVAALTIYDMCKALSHDIVITDIQLDKKTGGKSDYERA